MRITVFKSPKHKRFEYTPRYYDPAQELREERERRIRRELENESGEKGGDYQPISVGELRHNLKFRRPPRMKEQKGGILLRVITLVLALLVAFLVLYGTWVLVRTI
ncbi:MAG TPA: hypothetical protein P5228_07170 [Bacteroidales bacterium]|nr:hypothetical protein [Bacteroidales bacterium]HRZ48621.1 hypothetical protein [Bacteroidales bacterium]